MTGGPWPATSNAIVVPSVDSTVLTGSSSLVGLRHRIGPSPLHSVRVPTFDQAAPATGCLEIADRGADDGHLGNRLHRPGRRLDSAERGRAAGELALEPGRRAHDEEARRAIAPVGERVRSAARGEGDLARSGRDELVAELEDELALEDVEGFVEGVRVQRRPFAPGGIVLSISATRPLLSSLRTRTRGGEGSLDPCGELIGSLGRRAWRPASATRRSAPRRLSRRHGCVSFLGGRSPRRKDQRSETASANDSFVDVCIRAVSSRSARGGIKPGVPHDLPQVSIGIAEVPRVDAPRAAQRPGGSSLLQSFINFCKRSSQGAVDVQAAGAVGLEPATFGVTGRFGHRDAPLRACFKLGHLQAFADLPSAHTAWLRRP
jgi:hypothetical protein